MRLREERIEEIKRRQGSSFALSACCPVRQLETKRIRSLVEKINNEINKRIYF